MVPVAPLVLYIPIPLLPSVPSVPLVPSVPEVPEVPDEPDEPLVPQELTFAPGEGQIPVSVFKDENAEYLAFPTIFCGQKRPDNRDRVHNVPYSDICKYELRCVDRRVASNVPNLFFKVKQLQIKQVCDKVTLAL